MGSQGAGTIQSLVGRGGEVVFHLNLSIFSISTDIGVWWDVGRKGEKRRRGWGRGWNKDRNRERGILKRSCMCPEITVQVLIIIGYIFFLC